jgi:hypothetical protein
MLDREYDFVFRLRFDYHKFDYANYTNDIIKVIKNFNNFNNKIFYSVKVKNARGEDSFFFSSKENFNKIIKYILDNFKEIENFGKNVNYYFMPEDLIKYSCEKQQIKYISIGT